MIRVVTMLNLSNFVSQTLDKLSTIHPIRWIMPYSKKVQSNSTKFVDPRYEDEAISALMEEALSETTEETKFDVEKFINGEIDYA